MISRRRVISAGPLALTACGPSQDAYFGNTDPPKTQRLTMVLEGEPESIDPVLSIGIVDSLILSLFEGLTSLHPGTGEPMAGIATHFKAVGGGRRYTFYLRGHPKPRGTRLPDTRSLPPEFSRSRSAPPDGVPARWSDGRLITANDFVYSWRGALEPSTGSRLAFLLYSVRNGREVNIGKVATDQLGMRAMDDFTVQVDLEQAAPYFLELVSSTFRVPCRGM